MAVANGLEHHVVDFNAEVEFFKNKLKCPVNREVPGRMVSFKIADNMNIIVLPRDETHPEYAKFRGETVCLDVPNADEMFKEVTARGVKVRYGPVTQASGMRNFFFETPGGLTIEYETRPPK